MILRLGSYLQDRYEIIELIGSGGMAEVYRAFCHKMQRTVAIKVLKEEYNDNADFIKRFTQEALAAAQLSHPNGRRSASRFRLQTALRKYTVAALCTAT